jgi:hypothetical protein
VDIILCIGVMPRMGKTRSAYRILARKALGKPPFRGPIRYWKITLIWFLELILIGSYENRL